MPEDGYQEELKKEVGNFFKAIVRDKGHITIPIEERKLWEDGIKKNDTIYVKIILVERQGEWITRKKPSLGTQLKINEVPKITKK